MTVPNVLFPAFVLSLTSFLCFTIFNHAFLATSQQEQRKIFGEQKALHAAAWAGHMAL